MERSTEPGLNAFFKMNESVIFILFYEFSGLCGSHATAQSVDRLMKCFSDQTRLTIWIYFIDFFFRRYCMKFVHLPFVCLSFPVWFRRSTSGCNLSFCWGINMNQQHIRFALGTKLLASWGCLAHPSSQGSVLTTSPWLTLQSQSVEITKQQQIIFVYVKSSHQVKARRFVKVDRQLDCGMPGCAGNP